MDSQGAAADENENRLNVVMTSNVVPLKDCLGGAAVDPGAGDEGPGDVDVDALLRALLHEQRSHRRRRARLASSTTTAHDGPSVLRALRTLGATANRAIGTSAGPEGDHCDSSRALKRRIGLERMGDSDRILQKSLRREIAVPLAPADNQRTRKGGGVPLRTDDAACHPSSIAIVSSLLRGGKELRNGRGGNLVAPSRARSSLDLFFGDVNDRHGTHSGITLNVPEDATDASLRRLLSSTSEVSANKNGFSGERRAVRSVYMSGCRSITDSAIQILARGCPCVKSLDLSFCAQLTDKALATLASGESSLTSTLKEINLSSCPNITDKGLTVLLSECTAIQSLLLNSVPAAVTDEPLRALHEKKVLYGFRVHNSFKNATVLELDDNPGITESGLYWIARACPKLEVLSLRNCVGIGTSPHSVHTMDVFREMAFLSRLRRLDLSYCMNMPRECLEEFLNESRSRETIQYLGLSGIPSLNDDALCLLVSKFSRLTSLKVGSSQAVSDKSIHHLASHCDARSVIRCLDVHDATPPLTSSLVKLVTVTCIYLVDLDISQSPTIESLSLRYLDGLNHLERLNISSCPFLDDDALKWTTRGSLRIVEANNLPRFGESGIETLCCRQLLLTRLCVASCPLVTLRSVVFVVESCQDLEHLDVTNCDASISSGSLAEFVTDKNGSKREFYLTLNATGDDGDVPPFLGLVLTPENRKRRLQHRREQWILECHDASTWIQRIYRGHRGRKLADARRHQIWEGRRQRAMRPLGIFAKSCLRRIQQQKKDQAMLSIALVLQAKHYARCEKQRRRRLLHSLFGAWHELAASGYREKCALAGRHHVTRIKCRVIGILSKYDDPRRRMISSRHWKLRNLHKCWTHWAALATSAVRQRQVNARLFLHMARLETHNSRRQIHRTKLAVQRDRKLRRQKAWTEWRGFVTQSLEQKGQLAIAEDCYRLRCKVKCSHVLSNLSTYARSQRRLRELLATVTRHETDDAKRRALSCFRSNAHMRRVESLVRDIFELKRRKRLAKGFDTLYRHQLWCQRNRRIAHLVEESRKRRNSRAFLRWWRSWTLAKPSRIAIAASSTRHYEWHLLKMTLHRLSFAVSARALLERLARQHCTDYLKRLCFVTWDGFRDKAVRERMLAREKDCINNSAAVCVQRFFRGWLARKESVAMSAFQDWAVLLCQARARAFLAKKTLERKQRVLLLRELQKEMVEEERMCSEEKLLRRYFSEERVALTIQRTFRGKRGRLSFLEAMQRMCIDAGIQFHCEKNTWLQSAEKQRLLREEIRVERIISAIILQRVVRGVFGRRRFAKASRDALEARVATMVQAAFRGRKARRKEGALRRHRANLERVRRAKLVQRRILSLLGIRSHHSQRRALSILKALGMDLTSFMESISQQRRDVDEDAADFHGAARGTAVKGRVGFFVFLQRMYRITELPRRVHPEHVAPRPGCAVRVIQEKHCYVGMTGQILQIEQNTSGTTHTLRMDVDGRIVYLDSPPRPSLALRRTPSPFLVIDDMIKDSALSLCVSNQHSHLVSVIAFSEMERDMQSKVNASIRIQKMVRSYFALKRVRARVSSLRQNKAAFLKRACHAPVLTRVVSVGRSVSENHRVFHALEGQRKRWRRQNILKSEYRRRMTKSQSLMVVNNFFKSKRWKQCDIQNAKPFLDDFLFVAMSGGNKSVQSAANTSKARIKTISVRFPQLEDSPYLRIQSRTVYHGFSRKSMTLTGPVKVPHGLGYAEFLQGFGVGREDRTLIVSVRGAQDLLASGDSRLSDPYVLIDCNFRRTKTKIKRNTLDPNWNETFQFHVSDPNQVLRISVLDDCDRFSSSNFLGNVLIPLKDLEFGLTSKKWYGLTKYKSKVEVGMGGRRKEKLGRIELELLWKDLVTPDDVKRDELEKKAALLLQRWRRQTVLHRFAVVERKWFAQQLHFRNQNALILQCACRRRLAVRACRKARFVRQTAIRLQCFFRGQRAVKIVAKIRKLHNAARIVQCFVRCQRARIARRELLQIRNIFWYHCALVIQRNLRRHNAKKVVSCRKQGHLSSSLEPPTAAEAGQTQGWLTYGRAVGYSSKRLKRISLRVFDEVLRTKGSTLVGSLGEVIVDAYPAPYLKARDGADMVQVKILGLKCTAMPREERAALLVSAPRYTAILKVKEDISISLTVSWHIRVIQCFFRERIAANLVKRLRAKRHVALFSQRLFRRRLLARTKVVMFLQSRFRVYRANALIASILLQNRMALKLQCLFRCHLAHTAVEKRRRIDPCAVVESSSSLNESFSAMKTLDGRDDTFWCSQTNCVANEYILYDLLESSSVGKLSIRTGDMSSCPRSISIEASNDINSGFSAVVSISLRQSNSWQTFNLPKTTSRYWKLIIDDNYGSLQAITISGVRFIKAKEVSAHVLEHPTPICVSPGPSVGQTGQTVQLRCKADGWPLPTYQWFRGAVPIQHATEPVLTLPIEARVCEETKFFRCIHCKRVCDSVPSNVYSVLCSYCGTPCNSAKNESNQSLIKEIDAVMENLDQRAIGLDAKRKELEAIVHETSEGKIPESVCCSELNEVLGEVDSQIIRLRQMRGDLLRKKLRFDWFKIPYDGEGEYHCVIQNTRGETMKMSAASHRCAVYVSNPKPIVVKCVPWYTPRSDYKRRIFPFYQSVYSCFEEGRIAGKVVLKFENGATYIGPFVSAPDDARNDDHWGVWHTPEGDIYEGATLDNHFDLHNIQGCFNVAYKNGEKYKGRFVDCKRHGNGEFRYRDGSMYRGEWFRGYRQGLGTLSRDGSNYKGEWDRDQTHGFGEWKWNDGSSYVGGNMRGSRSGRGTYTDALGDVYEGSFIDNKMNGKGLFSHANGDKFNGSFENNKREGPGVFFYANGDFHKGTWKDDRRDGKFVIHRKVVDEIDVNAEWGDEVQVGLWDRGDFIAWECPPRNPMLTARFIARFKTNDDELDSRYAVEVARRLPFAPKGVDETLSDVQIILKRIAKQHLDVAGSNTFSETMERLRVIEDELTSTRREVLRMERKWADVQEAQKTKEEKCGKARQDVTDLEYQMTQIETFMETYWEDEPSGSRRNFYAACEELKHLGSDDWFQLRRHREPPQILKELMSVVCLLLNVTDDWKSALSLLGSSAQNKDVDDEGSLWQTYKNKMLFLLYCNSSSEGKHPLLQPQFDVYGLAKKDHLGQTVSKHLCDPKLRDKVYMRETFGAAAPRLLRWIEVALVYIGKAQSLLGKNKKLLELKNRVNYHRSCLDRAEDVLASCVNQAEEIARSLQPLYCTRDRQVEERDKLETLLAKCQNLGQAS